MSNCGDVVVVCVSFSRLCVCQFCLKPLTSDALLKHHQVSAFIYLALLNTLMWTTSFVLCECSCSVSVESTSVWLMLKCLVTSVFRWHMWSILHTSVCIACRVFLVLFSLSCKLRHFWKISCIFADMLINMTHYRYWNESFFIWYICACVGLFLVSCS